MNRNCFTLISKVNWIQTTEQCYQLRRPKITMSKILTLSLMVCTQESRIQSLSRQIRFKLMEFRAIWMTGHHHRKNFAQGKSLCLFHHNIKRKLMILELQITDSVKPNQLAHYWTRINRFNNNHFNNNHQWILYSNKYNNNKISKISKFSKINQISNRGIIIKDLRASKTLKSIPRRSHQVHPKRR